MARASMVHHIELYVGDLERSVAFWTPFTAHLGYEADRWSGGMTYVRGPDAPYVCLLPSPAPHRDAGYHRRRIGLNHLAFRAASRAQVDAVTDWLRACGHPLLYADRHPYAGGPGYYALFCEDPDRFKLEVVAPPDGNAAADPAVADAAPPAPPRADVDPHGPGRLSLSTARVFVDDLAEAHAFYGAALGLPLQAGGPAQGWCVYGTGGLQLVVEPVAADAADEDRRLVGRFTGLSFTVASVADAVAALRGRGVAFDGDPALQPWGGVLATCRDPSGNRLQLVQPPGGR